MPSLDLVAPFLILALGVAALFGVLQHGGDDE